MGFSHYDSRCCWTFVVFVVAADVGYLVVNNFPHFYFNYQFYYLAAVVWTLFVWNGF